MKLVLIAVAILGVCGAAPAAADMSFSQRSPRNIVSYSAVLPGLWVRVSSLADHVFIPDHRYWGVGKWKLDWLS